MMQLTQEKIKELFWYHADTGDFYWRKSSARSVKPWDKAGCMNHQGYIQIKINTKIEQAHRLAYLYVHGHLPKQVDHCNHNKGDNRIANLRAADNSKNSMNKGIQSNNTSGYKGVTFHKGTGKYHAKICVSGIRKSLGYFQTAEQAHDAYVKAAGELHGQFARFQ